VRQRGFYPLCHGGNANAKPKTIEYDAVPE
jgi:hypothetical protein